MNINELSKQIMENKFHIKFDFVVYNDKELHVELKNKKISSICDKLIVYDEQIENGKIYFVDSSLIKSREEDILKMYSELVVPTPTNLISIGEFTSNYEITDIEDICECCPCCSQSCEKCEDEE